MRKDPYKSESFLPEILSQPNLVSPKKAHINYTIHYPKPDLLSFAERVNKTVEWSMRNRSIIDRLTRNRIPSNYYSEMEKMVFKQHSDKPKTPPENTTQHHIRRRDTFPLPIYPPKNLVKFDRGIKNEEINQMLIQKPVVIYLKRIKSN